MKIKEAIFTAILFLHCTIAIAADQPAFEDAFSPKQGATQLVIKTIDEAKSSIRVAAYSFTSKPIADALIAAQENGIDVKIVLDKKQNTKSSLYSYMIENHIPTVLNRRYAIMHDKFIIVDNKILELGSFNYTKAAEDKNAENVLVVHDPNVIADYSKQWAKLWNEAAEDADEPATEEGSNR